MMVPRWLPVAVTLTAMACSEDGGTQRGGGNADAGARPSPTATSTVPTSTASTTVTAPPTSDAAPPGPPNAEALFADAAPVWHFALTLAGTDLDWLNDNATLEQYVPGSIALAGHETATAMVRYKGAYGSLAGCFDDSGELTCNKLSLKVSFNESDKAGRYLGLRKLLFHACARDVSCLRERISYGIFRDSDVEVSRASHATLSINGGPPSLYALVEYVDREFLEDHFTDSSGNLYKEVWPEHADPGPYQGALRTNETTADVTRFVDFAAAVGASSPSSFATDVSAYLDLARMSRYNAADQLINNWDGIWKFYCAGGGCGNHNYYVYEDPSTNQFAIIPWDLDHTFSRPNEEMGREYFDDSPTACDIASEEIVLKGITIGSRAAMCDPLMAGMMVGGWDGYRGALRSLLDGERTRLDAVLARLDGYRARIRPAVEADPLAPSVAEWEEDVARLRQVIRANYAEAEALLAE